MGQQTIWGLTRDAVADITATHDDPASIYRLLSTHSNYWGPKIVARVGVKKQTVHGIARNYLRLLKSVYENNFDGRGVDLGTARRMYVKYEGLIPTENTEPMLEKVR